MLTFVLTAATLLLPIFISAATPQSRPCLTGTFSHDDAVVEVRIALRFQESRFQTEWFLRSVAPRIVNPQRARDDSSSKSLPDAGDIIQEAEKRRRSLEPTRTLVASGALQTTFCVGRDVERDESIVLGVADREFTIRARPITWNRITVEELARAEGVRVLPGTRYIRYGTMPDVQLLDIARPDWIVLTSFAVRRDTAGRPMFYVELHNPQDHAQPGVEVALRFTGPPTVRCQEPAPRPPATEVKVYVGRDQKSTTIASTDPQFSGAAIPRTAVVFPESCWKLPLVVVPLGSTGLLVPGFSTFRYVFDSSSLVIRELVGPPGDRGPADVFGWPWVDIDLEGRAYPSNISTSLNR